MKKIIVLLMCMCGMAAQAQVFVGGTGRVGYANEMFTLGVLPEVGYEISERWAVGASLGMSMAAANGESEVLGVAEPFVRFTPWRNERVAFDVKALGEMVFQREMLEAEVGLRPSLRFFVNEHLDFTVDFGLLGATYGADTWRAAFLVNAMRAQLGVAYTF